MELDLQRDLNAPQRAAVEYCDGPELVIAGAGSGKTRVLTYKIAYLLDRGMTPWAILALTFTNKAAREMKERIAGLVGFERARYLNMGTFHSVFARILRRESSGTGHSPEFTIYDQSDSRSLVRAIINELGLDEKKYKPASVADRISRAKNRLIGPGDYPRSDAARDDAARQLGAVKDVYMRYAQRCVLANAMDFDDLLFNTYLLLKDNEEVRLKYSNAFDYILVDEYQDTNYAQQEIVRLLAREKQRVCVVGDDAQSIYSFRGAEIHNILNFQGLYPGTRLFKLEQNYRSTQNIVEGANSLICQNTEQISKHVYSEKEKGGPIVIKPATSDKEEAIIVCREISDIKKRENGQYSDFAILYRTNAQSRSFEEYLRKSDIPYKIYGGLSFYQRKEIKDVIAYMRIVVNPNDEEALKRVINYPARGIGDTTLRKIIECAGDEGTSLWDVMSHPAERHLSLSRATMAKVDAFREMVEKWMARVAVDDAFTLARDIMTGSGMQRDIYSGKMPDDISRQENIDELMGSVVDFVASRREEGRGDHVSIGDFLQEVALLTDMDDDKGDVPRVTLMTVHSAKGLEFPTVFIVGVEENIFPSPRAADTLKGLEEERRLLYVAITRAQRHCFLTFARNRMRYGRMEFDSPSRFIKEIDQRVVKVEGGMRENVPDAYPASRNSRRGFFGGYQRDGATVNRPSRLMPIASPEPNSSNDTASYNGLSTGMTIEHQRFGIGKVVKMEGTGENARATVVFQNAGTKQLLLKFAKYKIIG